MTGRADRGRGRRSEKENVKTDSRYDSERPRNDRKNDGPNRPRSPNGKDGGRFDRGGASGSRDYDSGKPRNRDARDRERERDARDRESHGYRGKEPFRSNRYRGSKFDPPPSKGEL